MARACSSLSSVEALKQDWHVLNIEGEGNKMKIELEQRRQEEKQELERTAAVLAGGQKTPALLL